MYRGCREGGAVALGAKPEPVQNARAMRTAIRSEANARLRRARLADDVHLSLSGNRNPPALIDAHRRVSHTRDSHDVPTSGTTAQPTNGAPVPRRVAAYLGW